jgi:hypothetical protein
MVTPIEEPQEESAVIEVEEPVKSNRTDSKDPKKTFDFAYDIEVSGPNPNLKIYKVRSNVFGEKKEFTILAPTLVLACSMAGLNDEDTIILSSEYFEG